jgi:hypothetical protein
MEPLGTYAFDQLTKATLILFWQAVISILFGVFG